MAKILLCPVLLGFACFLAAAYGAVHNQISYSIGPVYFHELKFTQFGIDPAYWNRIGAAIVGIKASWWMGVVIGVPVYLAAFFVRGTRRFVIAYLWSAIVVVLVTLALGVGSVTVAALTLTAENLPDFMITRVVSDPVSFAKAGIMHDFSYLGGLFGLIAGLVVTLRHAVQSRRASVDALRAD